MALEMRFRYNQPEYANPPAMVFRAVAVTDETEAVTAFIYWKWDDDPAMDWQLLGETKTGGTWEGNFNNPDNRSVRLAVVGQTVEGARSVTELNNAAQIVVTPTASKDAAESLLVASESLDALDLVNVWDDSGTPKVRKADATDDTKPAHGFVVEDVAGASFGPGDSVRVFYTGNVLRGLVGLVPNQPYFLSETAGEITATPVTGTGKILQVVGYAISTTDLMFEPEEPITRA